MKKDTFIAQWFLSLSN